MAKKSVWKKCSSCFETFRAEDDRSLNMLFEAHFVQTVTGPRCMGQQQREMSFARRDNAWWRK